MKATLTVRAAHRQLIQFIGPRSILWKDAPHHSGPHPLTPTNLEKHVPKTIVTESATEAAKKDNSSLSFSELPARYRRTHLSEAEMAAIESGGATSIF